MITEYAALYLNNTSPNVTRETIVRQLHAAGMTAAAWLVEGMLDDLIEMDEMASRLESVEAELDKLKEDTVDFDEYRSFFTAIKDAYDNTLGGWGKTTPDDDDFIAEIKAQLAVAAEREGI